MLYKVSDFEDMEVPIVLVESFGDLVLCCVRSLVELDGIIGTGRVCVCIALSVWVF